MNKRHKAELRAGLFLDLGLAFVMLALFFFRSNLSLSSHAVHYHFKVPDARGLVVGTKVLVAGLDAGKVDRLQLAERDRDVRVDIDVQKGFRNAIRQGSEVDLVTLGVLGDRAVSITAGSPERPPIPLGGDLPARPPAGLSQILERAGTLVTDLDRLTRDLDGIVEAFGGGGEGKKLSRDVARTLENLSSITGKLDRGLSAGEIAGPLRRLNTILSKLNNGSGTLGELLNDPRLYDDAKALVGEADRTRILRNLVRKTIEDSEKLQQERRSG